jgi:hypothetical protein
MLTKEEILELREQGLPILTRESWLNAKLRAKEFPNLFTVPTSKQIAQLKEGDYVKVGLEHMQPNHHLVTDRVWVQLTEAATIKGCVIQFTGKLATDITEEMYPDASLEYGDVVSLSDENIMNISWWNPEGEWQR